MSDIFITRSEFALNLGEALLFWQAVEHECYQIFRRFMKGADERMVSVVFFHVQSFKTKIEMLNYCAVYAIPDGSHRVTWDGLKTRVSAASIERNNLVHYHPHLSFNEEEDGEIKPRGYLLSPSRYDEISRFKEHIDADEFTYDVERIKKLARDFREIAMDLAAFGETLPQPPWPETLTKQEMQLRKQKGPQTRIASLRYTRKRPPQS